MDKELLKSIWSLITTIIWLLIFIKTSYDWTQGKQPDNFTVMMILLIAISLESKYNNRKQ